MSKTKEKETIKDLEKKIADLESSWKRVLADYANLEKRVRAEREDLIRFSNAALVDKLLAVLDSLETAERHLKDKGLSLTVNQLRNILQSEGVEEIVVLGEIFNPETMDCIEVVAGKEDVVTEVCQKGYKLLDRVIRPVKVKVGKGKQKNE